MTDEEAFYTLVEYRPIIGFVKYRKALEVASKALEKQIAKKPTDVRYFGEAGYYIGLCPVCGQGNNSDYPYCGDCGQKLDWSV